MRKFRADAKQISLSLAVKLYWEGGSLRQVSKVFGIDHANLMARFKRFGVPLKTKSDAMKGNPLIKRPKGANAYNWKGGYYRDSKGYLVNTQTKVRAHREKAKAALGRELKTDEVVHHLSCDPEVLILCSKSYHHWLHAKMNNWLIGQNYKKEI